MSNELTKTDTERLNALAAFAQSLTGEPPFPDAEPIDFCKTFFRAGRDNDRVLPLGTEFTADMGKMVIGQRMLRQNCPARHCVVNAVEAAVNPTCIPRRDQLGDHDESLWPTGLSGLREDPWKPVAIAPFIDNDGRPHAFVAASAGSRKAMARLFKAWVAHGASRNPKIRLATTYTNNRSYGKILELDFPIFAWAGEAENAAPTTPTVAYAPNAAQPAKQPSPTPITYMDRRSDPAEVARRTAVVDEPLGDDAPQEADFEPPDF